MCTYWVVAAKDEAAERLKLEQERQIGQIRAEISGDKQEVIALQPPDQTEWTPCDFSHPTFLYLIPILWAMYWICFEFIRLKFLFYDHIRLTLTIVVIR